MEAVGERCRAAGQTVIQLRAARDLGAIVRAAGADNV